uniref:Uncharacterized protein n=1 Tax=Noccaea caerulescens TaxID=107243 RepID=A0A1J3FVR0_NOCCA
MASFSASSTIFFIDLFRSGSSEHQHRRSKEAAGGSDWAEIAAVVDEEGAIEVFPVVFGGVEDERRRIWIVADHEEPRISTRDLRTGEVEAF